MGIIIGSATSSSSSTYKTGFTGGANIGDQFELGYSFYPTVTGESSWALSENPVNLAGIGYPWGASVSIPEVTEAIELDKSSTNTAAIIAASLDGNAAQVSTLYTQNDYSGYVLPSYEGGQKMEIGLVPIVGSIFLPYDGISFWTSTEKDALNAYYFTIRDGLPWIFGHDLKTSAKAVWPIIRFNYQA
jgi:hypothetical protein